MPDHSETQKRTWLQQPAHSPPLPPAREPDLAVEEEFQAAAAAGTVAAWDLFIARHPADRRIPQARTARARLLERR